MRLSIAIALTLLAAGCGSNEPFCALPIDVTGRATAYCPGHSDDPVCDVAGDRAHYVDGPLGIELAGGARASCNEDDEVVCPSGTVGPAYCLRDPEL